MLFSDDSPVVVVEIDKFSRSNCSIEVYSKSEENILAVSDEQKRSKILSTPLTKRISTISELDYGVYQFIISCCDSASAYPPGLIAFK